MNRTVWIAFNTCDDKIEKVYASELDCRRDCMQFRWECEEYELQGEFPNNSSLHWEPGIRDIQPKEWKNPAPNDFPYHNTVTCKEE